MGSITSEPLNGDENNSPLGVPNSELNFEKVKTALTDTSVVPLNTSIDYVINSPYFPPFFPPFFPPYFPPFFPPFFPPYFPPFFPPYFPPYFPPFFPPYFPPFFPPAFQAPCTPTCTLVSTTGPGSLCPNGSSALKTTYSYSCSGCSPCSCPAPPAPTEECIR